MKTDFSNSNNVDLNQSIEKAMKKYTLEVDDAIEAHGFKASSYIDYAEDSISEYESIIKKHFSDHYGDSNLLYKNLEISLNELSQNILNNTIEESMTRNDVFANKLEQKSNYLNSNLKNLNNRLLFTLSNI